MAARFPSIWLGDKRGYLTDWITQRWVQFTGREVDLTVESWLDGPVGDTEGIGGSYFQRFSTDSNGLNSQRIGLVQDFDLLKGDSFAPQQIDPKIKDFYENTSRYELDVWSQWSGLFKPFGWLLAFIFSRRLQQMNMPISSLDTSKGMTSVTTLKIID